MNAVRLILIVFLVPLVLSSGCSCRKTAKAPDIRFTEAGGVHADKEQQQKKDFENALEILDSLEDTPRLPEMPGYERLVQTADRLNRWIQNHPVDETWKPDPTFLEIETASGKAARTAGEIVDLLHLLQENENYVKGKPIADSDSRQDELKKIVELFSTMIDDLTTLSKYSGFTDMLAFSRQVEELQKKFDVLVKRPNLSVGTIRTFTRQLSTETAQFVNIAENLQKFTSELRTEGLFIQLSDVEYLKQSIWLRDLSNWTRGDRQALLERVTNLFDWTICNIELREKTVQMDRNRAIEMPQQYPWQTMLLGYGPLWDRTMVFVELLRQQRIDACLLAVPHPEDPKQPLFWGIGVLLEGELYIYIPQYGMPLPGPGGPKIAEDGSLSFPEIATFSQVLKEDKLLRQLDFSEEQKFPLTVEMLADSRAYLIAAPETVSMRMKVMEAELSGEQSMVLFTNIHEQRRQFGEIPGIKGVEIWKYPFRTKFEQMLMFSVTNEFMALFLAPNPKRLDYPLWTGRVLYFKGRVSGQDSAITKYQDARISDRDIMEFRNDPAFRNNPLQTRLYQMVTLNATYWLGLASFEADKDDMISSAKDFLMRIRSNSLNTWRNGTEYALGRIAEKEKRYQDAVDHYRRTTLGISGAGNELRAQWLEKATGLPTAPKAKPEPSSEASNAPKPDENSSKTGQE